jgi:hypothetical protein
MDLQSCGEKNESSSVCQAHLSQMQNYSSPRCCPCDLFRSAPQATSRLIRFKFSYRIAGSHFEPAQLTQLDSQLNVVEDKVSVWPVLQA